VRNASPVWSVWCGVPLAMTNASSWHFSDARCRILLSIVWPADEPEYEYGLSLPDQMRMILCLQIHLRILIVTMNEIAFSTLTHPVLVVEHDCVYCGQVDAEPAGASAQEEQTWRI
jgi:hypothetical protein